MSSKTLGSCRAQCSFRFTAVRLMAARRVLPCSFSPVPFHPGGFPPSIPTSLASQVAAVAAVWQGWPGKRCAFLLRFPGTSCRAKLPDVRLSSAAGRSCCQQRRHPKGACGRSRLTSEGCRLGKASLWAAKPSTSFTPGKLTHLCHDVA